MLATFRGGARLLLPLLLLPVLAACDKKEEEQKEPTVLNVSGPNSCSAVIKTLEFSVVCDLKWTAELENAEWAKVESTAPTPNGGSVVVRFDVNREAGERTGTLVITSGTKTFRKTFTQGGLDEFFMPRELHLAGTQESYLIFDSPYAWKASIAEGADWIDLKTTEGDAGYARIPVVAKDPNENIGDRSGSLTVSVAGEDFSIPVVQSQTDIILTDNASVSMGYRGGNFTVITQSNVTYKIECEAEWIQHAETKALNVAQESFTVEANSHTSNSREAIISFIPTEGSEKVRVDLRVRQAGVDEFVFNVRMPGIFYMGDTSYPYGVDGWNLSSTVLHADGSPEFRILNRSKVSAIIITGYDPAGEEGSVAHLSVVGLHRAETFLSKEFNATLIDSNEELMWYRTADGTGFVIQK